MNSNKKTLPLKSIHGIKARINTQPDFQRPAVWSMAQKQLLIDTILRDYDIPKLYWRKISSQPDMYDVVDGQQRLRAIWEFFDGVYELSKESDLIEGVKVAGCSYDNLPDDLRFRFDVYPLDVVILENTDEEEVREMFLRLQNGTSLKAQEKRNAYPGKMRDFVRSLSKHNFFKKVGFSNSRFTYDLVVAQIVCLELAGGPSNVKDADLNRMYKKYLDFDVKSSEARSVIKGLNTLDELFTVKTPELERYNVISLYCIISELLKQYVIDDAKPFIYSWFISFEKERREQEAKSEDDAIPEWTTYKEKISHSTDAEESIRWRMEFMLRRFLETYPNIRLKDNQRDFTYLQRLAIFRRDNMCCQLKITCSGDKLVWDDWHCDHITPWSRGGKTTVENGQAACSSCNCSKGGD